MRLVVGVVLAVLALAVQGKPFHGHLYVDPEGEAFYPCGSKQGYWFLASDETRNRIITEGAKKSSALSEEGVFVELDGRIGGKLEKNNEASENYKRYFHIDHIKTIRKVSPNDCRR